jgi:uncharacterized protein (DUF2141 family)
VKIYRCHIFRDPFSLKMLLVARQLRCSAAQWQTLLVCALTILTLSSCASIGSQSAPEAPNAELMTVGRIELELIGIDASGSHGPIRIALWAHEQTFMHEGAWACGLTINAADAHALIVIPNLALGRYALSAFHDLTNCGALRRGAFGIPRDPWAFSNGGSSLLPPSWKHASFEVDGGTTRVVLDFTHNLPAKASATEPTRQ